MSGLGTGMSADPYHSWDRLVSAEDQSVGLRRWGGGLETSGVVESTGKYDHSVREAMSDQEPPNSLVQRCELGRLALRETYGHQNTKQTRSVRAAIYKSSRLSVSRADAYRYSDDSASLPQWKTMQTSFCKSAQLPLRKS